MRSTDKTIPDRDRHRFLRPHQRTPPLATQHPPFDKLTRPLLDDNVYRVRLPNPCHQAEDFQAVEDELECGGLLVGAVRAQYVEREAGRVEREALRGLLVLPGEAPLILDIPNGACNSQRLVVACDAEHLGCDVLEDE